MTTPNSQLMALTCLLAAILTTHACRTSDNAVSKDIGLSPTDMDRAAIVLWEDGGLVRIGACPQPADLISHLCSGLRLLGDSTLQTMTSALEEVTLAARSPGQTLVYQNPAKILFFQQKLDRIDARLALSTISQKERSDLENQSAYFKAALAKEEFSVVLSDAEKAGIDAVLKSIGDHQKMFVFDEGEDRYKLVAAAVKKTLSHERKSVTSTRATKVVPPPPTATITQVALNDLGSKITGLVQLEDETVVVATENRKVIWFKAGVMVTEVSIAGKTKLDAPWALADGTVVVTSEDHVFWLKNGALVHDLTLENYVNGPKASLSDGTMIVISPEYYKVYWVKGGKKLAESTLSNKIWASPAVLSDNSIVLPSNDGKLYWLKDGKQIKVQNLNDVDAYSLVSLLEDGTIFVTGALKKLLWIKDGAVVHEYAGRRNSVGLAFNSGGTPLPNGDILIAGSRDDALWIKDGQVRAELSTQYGFAVPSIYSDSSVVATFQDDSVRWLRSGREILRFDAEGTHETPRSPLLLSDGTVVAGIGSKLYWLKPEAP